MRKEKNPLIESILKEESLRQKYENIKKKGQTIAQFQLKHCRYCKNKDTQLCEIRKDFNNNYRCEYEESLYERKHIK